jgi:hypothetical protein
VRVQMIEIYNEQVRDLLMTDGANRKYPFVNNKLHLYLDKNNNLNKKCEKMYFILRIPLHFFFAFFH